MNPNKTFKEMGIDSFPLHWPTGWVRAKSRTQSRFSNISFERARMELFNEIKLMGCQDYNIVLSTNIPLRRDGMPYAGMANPSDPGVAVYFRVRGKPMVIACDAYIKIMDNLWAIRKTIEAMRGIDRWGASEMLERAFTGFAALPPPTLKKEWWDVLEVRRDMPIEIIKQKWIQLSKTYHPDRPGGNAEKMKEINEAYQQAMSER